jgi:hypothetical protein
MNKREQSYRRKYGKSLGAVRASIAAVRKAAKDPDALARQRARHKALMDALP